jgi:hypothetical protein
MDLCHVRHIPYKAWELGRKVVNHLDHITSRNEKVIVVDVEWQSLRMAGVRIVLAGNLGGGGEGVRVTPPIDIINDDSTSTTPVLEQFGMIGTQKYQSHQGGFLFGFVLRASSPIAAHDTVDCRKPRISSDNHFSKM